MVLRESIGELAVAAMRNLTTQGLAYGSWRGIMPIGRHPLWSVTDHSDGLFEQAVGRPPLSLLTHHRVNQLANPINGPVEITPFPLNGDVGFIHLPGPRLFALVVLSAVGLLTTEQSALTSPGLPHG